MKKLLMLLFLFPMMMFQNCGKYGPNVGLDYSINEDDQIVFNVCCEASKDKDDYVVNDCGIILFKDTDREIEFKADNLTASTTLKDFSNYSVPYTLDEDDYDKDIKIEYYFIINDVEYKYNDNFNLLVKILNWYKNSSSLSEFENHVIDVCNNHYITDIRLNGDYTFINEERRFFTLKDISYTPGLLTIKLDLARNYDTSDLSYVKVYLNDELVNATCSYAKDVLTLNIEYYDYNIREVLLTLDDSKNEDSFENYAYFATLNKNSNNEVTVTVTSKTDYSFIEYLYFEYNGKYVNDELYTIEGNTLTYTYNK